MKQSLLAVFLLFSFSSFAHDLNKVDTNKNVIEKYQEAIGSKFGLLPHNETFLLPISYNGSPDVSVYNKLTESDLRSGRGDFYDKLEAEFQISFMLPISRNIFKSNWDILVGYTHRAWWQVYNDNWSRPFRETNYSPEIFFRKLLPHSNSKLLGLQILGYDIGYIHQSNGQIQEISRSWDRIIGRIALGGPKNLLQIASWIRIDDRGQKDDNPKIVNYLGLGEIKWQHQVFKGHKIGLKIIPGFKHLSGAIDYSLPWKDRLNWFIKYESGYGHSLIEYNRRAERVGFGVNVQNIF